MAPRPSAGWERALSRDTPPSLRIPASALQTEPHGTSAVPDAPPVSDALCADALAAELGLSPVIGLGAVVAVVTEEVPRILVLPRRPATGSPETGKRTTGKMEPVRIQAGGEETLPFGLFDPAEHRTLQLGLRSRVAERTGLTLPWVEQLYTFGDRGRDPAERNGGPRLLTIAYLALLREPLPVFDARWREWYDFLPWEDWRDGRPTCLDEPIRRGLQAWIGQATGEGERRGREERVSIAFGFGAAPWDPARTLERYEALYEAGLVAEAVRDRGERPSAAADRLGAAMALDDRRILATALGRLRGKLAYRPVVFELVPDEFTLLHLQQVVEALAGQRLHKQNFRRMLVAGELVEPTGRIGHGTRGRPAELFRFRRAVLRAKPSAGVALPTRRGGS